MKREIGYRGNRITKGKLWLLAASSIFLLIFTSCHEKLSSKIESSNAASSDIVSNNPVNSNVSGSTSIAEKPQIPSFEPNWTIPDDAPNWFNNEFITPIKLRLEGIKAEFTADDGVPWGGLRLHLAFADLTDDGIPEVFYGYHGVHNTDLIYYYIYSSTEQMDIIDSAGYLVTVFEPIESTSILSDKFYLDLDGEKYFESLGDDYSGDMYVNYVTKIWRENSQWKVDYTYIDQNMIGHFGSYREGGFFQDRGYEEGEIFYGEDAIFPEGYKNPDKSFPLVTSAECVDTNGDIIKLILDCCQYYQTALVSHLDDNKTGE